MEIPRFSDLGHLPVLDYLALLWPDRSRRTIEGLFAAGRIRSGGRPVGMRRQVGGLADLALEGTLDGAPRIPLGPEGPGMNGPGAESAGLRVLLEDARFIVLDKPSGMPVVPDRTRSVESCLGFLVRRELEARQDKAPREFVRYRTVHRIDRFTSGIVLFARTPDVERRLARDFETRRVYKEYVALVCGLVEPARITVDCPVVAGRKGKMRAEVPADLRPRWREMTAVTRFDVLRRSARATLVRAVPRTGRTHQIRVHAYAAGHPLAIDPLYRLAVHADLPPPDGIERLTLHALRLVLPHDWERPRSFESELPADFQAALQALGGS